MFTTPQQVLKRYWEKRRDDSLMLATIIIHEDTWKVLNMQHITSNSKRRDYSNIPSGGVWKIKGPAYLVDGSHHHKGPQPPPPFVEKEILYLLHQEITMLWLPYLLSNNPQSHKRVHSLHIHVSCEQLCDMRIEFSSLYQPHFVWTSPAFLSKLSFWFVSDLDSSNFKQLVFGRTVNISHSWFLCPGH